VSRGERLVARARLAGVLCAWLGVALLAGCAKPVGPEGRGDPLEPMNRGVFWFNEQADRFVLNPVSEGWDFLLPDVVEESIQKFFLNLRYPLNLANSLLQGKPRRAGVDTGRFVINSTVGVLGFFDPATAWGLARREEDFGQTLGWWGMGFGPYLVLPLLGPSSPRDIVALPVDGALAVYPFFVDWWVSAAARGVQVVNLRSQLDEEIEENRREAFDYYAFVRNAYFQYRQRQVDDGEDEAEEPAGESLYYPDTEE
jgi:phospholipid-binding lipoprotein MlaA